MNDESRHPSLGDQFKDARTIKHLTLEELEQQTKVRLKHLQAIEEGNYRALPPDVFALGFVRRYAKILGLDPEVAANIFRRERAAARSGRTKAFYLRPTALVPGPRFVLSTKMIVSALAALVVLLLFGYIWYQVRLFAAPPQLAISSPAEQATVYEATILVIGQTNPSATLFINNEGVPLDEDGSFRQDVKLTPGVNQIEVKAVNRLEKEAIKTITILYEQAAVDITPPTDTNEPLIDTNP